MFGSSTGIGFFLGLPLPLFTGCTTSGTTGTSSSPSISGACTSTSSTNVSILGSVSCITCVSIGVGAKSSKSSNPSMIGSATCSCCGITSCTGCLTVGCGRTCGSSIGSTTVFCLANFLVPLMLTADGMTTGLESTVSRFVDFNRIWLGPSSSSCLLFLRLSETALLKDMIC